MTVSFPPVLDSLGADVRVLAFNRKTGAGDMDLPHPKLAVTSLCSRRTRAARATTARAEEDDAERAHQYTRHSSCHTAVPPRRFTAASNSPEKAPQDADHAGTVTLISKETKNALSVRRRAELALERRAPRPSGLDNPTATRISRRPGRSAARLIARAARAKVLAQVAHDLFHTLF